MRTGLIAFVFAELFVLYQLTAQTSYAPLHPMISKEIGLTLLQSGVVSASFLIILRHVGMWASELWNNGVRIAPSTGPPAGGIIECGQLVIEPWLDDPMPDYDSNPPLWQV